MFSHTYVFRQQIVCDSWTNHAWPYTFSLCISDSNINNKPVETNQSHKQKTLIDHITQNWVTITQNWVTIYKKIQASTKS